MKEDMVTVKMDRPIGSAHPQDPTMIYPVNYGYIESATGSQTFSQDAYVLGVDVPIDEFTGRCIAIVHRRDDVQDQFVVAPDHITYTRQQIEEMVYFQEQYFDSYIEILNDEIWDAYDQSGEKLGFDIKRSQAKSLPEGVYHIAVLIYTVTRDGKILLTQRAANKTNSLKWEVTGGSILKGELPRQGAVRELAEETGIIVQPQDLQNLYHFTDHKRHCIYYSYLNIIPEQTAICLQEGETADYQYMPYGDFTKFVRTERFVPSEQCRFLAHEAQIDQCIRENMSTFF